DDEWDWDELEDALQEQFQAQFDIQPGTPDEVASQVWPVIEETLAEREQKFGEVNGGDKARGRTWLMYFQRTFWLEEIDQQWIEHLKTMDALREGIGLQGYGQKDPKKEYKRIGFDMFSEMMGRIQANAIGKLFKVQLERKQEAQVPAIQEKERDMEERGVAGKSEDETEASDGDGAAQQRRPARRSQGGMARADGGEPKGETVRREKPKVGRNDPCPCGSGKKYKKCHGKDEEAAATE
nr:SEC-C domain-containing protein [Deltaproteobacteria bacterium]